MSATTAASGQAVVQVRAPYSTLNDSTFPLPFSTTDIVVFALILIFGAAAFLFQQRAVDFLGEDAFYADCARSLLAHGFYGIQGRPETNQPPGLPAMLAVLFAVFGYSRSVCLHAMAVLETLGFLAAYALLRRRLPRLIAASICLLLISSPLYFRMATQGVWPCFPALFTTMTALLSFEEYERAFSTAGRVFWGVVLASMTLASMMIASGTMALVGGMIAVIGVTALKNRPQAWPRLKRLLPIILLGVAAQGLWMHRKPAPLEWRLPGYPASYVQQLKVKSGNYPELGMATLGDIPVRVATNLSQQSGLLIYVLVRHGVKLSKEWILIVPILLILTGWIYSVWQTGGGLPEWYFLAYEFIYLLWPWQTEERFVFPIFPLACLYAWQGIKAILLLLRTKPRASGIVGTVLGVLFGASGWYWINTHWALEGHGLDLLPDELMAPAWCILAVCAARMAYTGQPLSLLVPSSNLGVWFRRPLRWWGKSPSQLAQDAAWMMVLALIAIGIGKQASEAKANWKYMDLRAIQDASRNPMASEVKGALWIRSHTPAASVVMARHLPIVSHYADRKMVWFAPVSDPDSLMQGIINHNVDYILVIRHKVPYYLPDDDSCFDPLMKTRENVFRLAFQDSNLRIYQVEKNLLSGNAQLFKRSDGALIPAGRTASSASKNL